MVEDPTSMVLIPSQEIKYLKVRPHQLMYKNCKADGLKNLEEKAYSKLNFVGTHHIYPNQMLGEPTLDFQS